jgi:hypothetical protein
MTHHVPRAHSPEEMRRFSNIGHWVEGAIISGAGGLMLWEALSGEARAEKAASSMLAGGGLLLGLGLVAGSLEHGGPRTFFRADHQQREHLQMAGLLTAGVSLAEPVGSGGSRRPARRRGSARCS